MRRLFPILIFLIITAALGVVLLFGAWFGDRYMLALNRVIQEGDPWLAPYVGTPQEIVEKMLEMAEVGKDDIVYDLGSGDGRIVITAARRYGARGVGFELDEDLVRLSQDNARRAGVNGLVEFHLQDVMTVDLSPATVVTVYLVQDANLRLRPRILSQLRLGSRLVSHKFHMGDWQPERVERVRAESGDLHTLYLWRIGPRRPTG